MKLKKLTIVFVVLTFFALIASAGPGTIFAGIGITTNFDGILTTDNTFIRPDFNTLLAGDDSYNYFVRQLTPDATGTYSIAVTNCVPDLDPTLYIYVGSFDPANPTVNLVAGDDDDGPGLYSLIEWDMTAGTKYFAVMSTFSTGETGHVYFSATGPGNMAVVDINTNTETESRSLTKEEIVALNLTIQQQVDRYGATNNGFIEMLYDNALERVYDGGGFGDWTGELAANTMTGSQIAYHFIFSDELAPTINSLSENDFIAFLYQTLMNRLYDLEGYANWQQHMEAGMTREEMVSYFVNSPEFAGICTLFNVTP
jgi:hypothetical protein